MGEHVVFYSWQSDLPNRTNRTLIEGALNGAAEALRADTEVAISPVIDRDTRGVPGAPDIAQTILAKIEAADAFVCDVSFVTGGVEGIRPIPNPNVLIELGFALRALGWERIVMVFNLAYGGVEELPFDLRQKRALTYRSSEEDAERAPARAGLARALQGALRDILFQPRERARRASPLDDALEAVASSRADAAAAVADFMSETVDSVLAARPVPPSERPYEDLLVEGITRTADVARDFARLAEAVGRHGNSNAMEGFVRGFERLLQFHRPPPRTAGVNLVSDGDLPKFYGHELYVTLVSTLLRHRRFDMLATLLQARLMVDTNNGHKAMPFSLLSAPVPALWNYFEKRQESLVSPQGHLLRARHSEDGPLAKVAAWTPFMEADFLLYFRSTMDTDAIRPWVPWSYPYLDGVVSLEWLARARSRRYLAELRKAFGGITEEGFRKLFADHCGNATKVFPMSMGWVTLPPPETLGSEP